MEALNKTGVLAEVAAMIGDTDSNIEQVSVVDRHEDDTVLNFLLQVKDRIHLARVMRNIKNMPNVLRVTRDSA